MATAFAITGIHRSRLKHYRPSYQSELPPIYEDAASSQTAKRDKYKCIIHGNDDYVYIPSFMQNGRFCKQNEKHVGFVHDYEEIDAVRLSQVTTSRPDTPTKPSKSMLHGIMSNRMQAKNKTFEINEQSDSDIVNDENIDKRTDTAPEEESTLRRASSVYQGYSPTNDGTTVVKTGADSAGENDSSTKKWPKLKPESLKLPHFLCPAEEKIKKRCFAVCFVVLILLIGTFVVVCIDGWVYRAKGQGLGLTDREKPILWNTFGTAVLDDNFTDVRQTNIDEDSKL